MLEGIMSAKPLIAGGKIDNRRPYPGIMLFESAATGVLTRPSRNTKKTTMKVFRRFSQRELMREEKRFQESPVICYPTSSDPTRKPSRACRGMTVSKDPDRLFDLSHED